ncbi:MAG: hypothetical protein ACF8SC_05935 [Phycisphaerales bacterium JB037]
MADPRPVPTPPPTSQPHRDPLRTVARRELFWHNVVREILTSLSIVQVSRRSGVYDPEIEHATRETFDGRYAVITTLGQRIPIAEVHPLFACSINHSPESRDLSSEVQCTVFQIRTPAGEVYTIPLHEIRSFHALTPELMAQLEAQARLAADGPASDADQPFGFAAFTSISNQETVQEAGKPAEQEIPGRIIGPGVDPLGEPGELP